MFRDYERILRTVHGDSGATALAIVCSHHRQPISAQQVRELAGVDRVGSSHQKLSLAAEKLGYTARAVRGNNETLSSATLPAIAHMLTPEGRGQFVVIHQVSSGRVVLADQVLGVQTMPRDEFCRSWTGYLMLLAPERSWSFRAECDSIGPWRWLSMRLHHQFGRVSKRLSARRAGGSRRLNTQSIS